MLTSRECESTAEIIFSKQNIGDLTRKLKSVNGKNIWICGGASVINQFHKLGLIDEYTITVMPTILGDGIRLFETSEDERKLKLLSTRAYNGIVDLTYESRK